MKKILFNTLPVAMVMLASLSACSSEDVANEGNGKGEPQLDIKLSENDFGSDDATRYIMADSYVVDSQQVDLGNGLVADVVVTKDPAESSDDNTRALGDGTGLTYNARAGEYIVKAYGISPTTDNYTFTGTTNGSGVFTKTGDWTIKKGKYKFACYRPDGFYVFTLSGYDALRVAADNTGSYLRNQDRSLLSDVQDKEIVGGSNTIDFTLKQRTSGVRVKFATSPSANTLSDLAATLTSPNRVTAYLIALNNYANRAGTNEIATTLSFTGNTSEYVYYPDQIAATDMKVNFTGGKVVNHSGGADVNLAGKEIALKGFTTTEGHRYTVNVTLKTNSVPTYSYKAYAAAGTNGSIVTASQNTANVRITNNNSASVTLEGDENGNATIKATPATGYLFEKWTNGSTTNYTEELSFTIKDHHNETYTANYVKKYEILGTNSQVLRGKFQGQKVTIGSVTDTNGNVVTVQFQGNADGTGTFYAQETTAMPTGNYPGYTYTYDPNSKIYTISITQESPMCTDVSKCTHPTYVRSYAFYCPFMCNSVSGIPDDLKK